MGILYFFFSLQRVGSHVGCSECWIHWCWRYFEVGSLSWYVRWKKTRPCVSLSCSEAHPRTEPRLTNVRVPVMPFVNAGISKSRWYLRKSILAYNSFMRRLMSSYLLHSEWIRRMLPDTSLVNTPRSRSEWGGMYKYRFIAFSYSDVMIRSPWIAIIMSI